MVKTYIYRKDWGFAVKLPPSNVWDILGKLLKLWTDWVFKEIRPMFGEYLYNNGKNVGR